LINYYVVKVKDEKAEEKPSTSLNMSFALMLSRSACIPLFIGVAVMVATVVASMRASVCSHFVFVLQYIVFLMLFVDL